MLVVMIQREMVFDEAPFASCHASTVSPAAVGSIVAAWFAGTREGADDVRIWSATRTGEGWSAPAVVASAPDDVACWNPVLHEGRLLFFKAGTSPKAWSGLLCRATPGGWSAPQILPAGVLGPVKNKPYAMPGGVLLCGTSVESYGAWGCWVDRTTDDGATWSKHGPVNVPGHPHGIIQPAIAGTPDHLAMLCRSRGLGRIVRATSEDGGLTWTDAEPIDLPHNNSGLDAVTLADGRIALAYNHTTRGRSPLNLATSTDGGVTWVPGPVLEDEPGEYSYPAIVQDHEGRIHVTYTWRRRLIAHVTLDPEDLA